jgi:HSP20 family molecular chaperone IbpA
VYNLIADSILNGFPIVGSPELEVIESITARGNSKVLLAIAGFSKNKILISEVSNTLTILEKSSKIQTNVCSSSKVQTILRGH